MDDPFFLLVVFIFLLVYVYLYEMFIKRLSNRNLHTRKTGDRTEKGR
jgi:hypothetical protein